jgi:hypothetical protein
MAQKQGTNQDKSGEVSPGMHKLEFVWIEPTSAGQTNPLQWRKHGEIQKAALRDLIFGDDGEGGGEDFVGWAKPIVINNRLEKNGWKPDEAIPTVVDGHGRLEVATQIPGSVIPAGIGEWTPRQERILLRFLDPLAALAGIDFEQAKKLDAQVETTSEALGELAHDFRVQTEALAELDDFGEFPDLPPLDENKADEETHFVIKVKVIDETQFNDIAEGIRDLADKMGWDIAIDL